jgi:hypothetical protein
MTQPDRARVRDIVGVACLVGGLAAAGMGPGGSRSVIPAAAGEADGPTLRRIATIDLPGPAGKRFDYLAIDEADHYLFSAHLAAGLLHVIDVRTNAVVKTIPGVPGVEGVAYIPDGRKVYTSNWGETRSASSTSRGWRCSRGFPPRTSRMASPTRPRLAGPTCRMSELGPRASSM